MFLGRRKRDNLFEMCYAVTRVTLNQSEVWSIQKHQYNGFSPL